MIISVHEALSVLNIPNEQVNPELLGMKLRAIEQAIRSYTHNDFSSRDVRFMARSDGDCLFAPFRFLRQGDTVQISGGVNDGLYVVETVEENSIRLEDADLFPTNDNCIAKVEYPDDVKAGALNLLSWEIKNRDKVGIKSETLSRHSVTYYDQDSTNQVMGYPASLFGFLKPYRKARF